ncbi:GATA zinc finger domain-containing protein 14 [Stomoxys calcitrans]|uniref:MADF domain-containing protein n=1 Tax=Stomoxys calcitrans TaxID=35570 RepID=A0A1I8Q2P7_STOCA|nr:GATA zinc finger domain-containing protein 14 [Stomoxys calcitrans]
MPSNSAMDEQLIDEVALHAVIYNRQKYYLNGCVNGQNPAANKYETKDEAWQEIAMKLRSDVETCKKRWKYLRERYVSQRKQGDPPVYEHLSRPYLEKMKFLDQHIQPRKSYRNVPNFLTSPHSANGSNFNDYNMDSKSNSSLKSMGHFGQHHPFQDQQHAMNALSSAAAAASALEGDGRVKLEADQVFRDFAAAVHGQLHHQQAAVAAALAADPSQSYNEHFRDAANALSAVASAQHNGNGGVLGGMHSSSSSVKSPLSSPLGATHNGTNSAGHSSTPTHQSSTSNLNNATSSAGPSSSMSVANNHFSNSSFSENHQEDMDSSSSGNYVKKPRVHLMNHTASETATAAQQHSHNNGLPHHHSNSNGNANANHQQQHSNNHHQQHANNALNNSNSSQFGGGDETDEDSDENSASMLQPQTILNEHNNDNPYNSALAAPSPAPSNASSTNALQRSVGAPQHLNANTSNGGNMFSTNADFLQLLYQQLPHSQQQNNMPQQQGFGKFQVPHNPPPTPPAVQRSSEQLLGELVTTELLKMSKERRKSVQKRILEILFFDD